MKAREVSKEVCEELMEIAKDTYKRIIDVVKKRVHEGHNALHVAGAVYECVMVLTVYINDMALRTVGDSFAQVMEEAEKRRRPDYVI